MYYLTHFEIKKLPLELVYYEIVDNESEALRKEKYFKSGFGRKYIKNKLKIKALSSPPALPVVGSGQVTVRTSIMYYVYVLKSKIDNDLYYGFTNDLEKRLERHNRGDVRSTSNRRPLELVYYEIVDNESEALRKEKYFKSGFGRKYIKNKLKIKALSSNG